MNDIAVALPVPDFAVARKGVVAVGDVASGAKLGTPLAAGSKPTAAARRRRMAKRRLEKRVSHSIALVGGLYILASVFAPNRASTPASSAQKLAIAPVSLEWKPAGDVLQRKSDFKAVRPWAPDTTTPAPRASLTRWHRIFVFATNYKINADLATKIYDAAIEQAIEPELAFRLVNVESEFKTRAGSSAGALGLTQLMLSTARGFEPNVSREDLMDPETNLRIGLKYLRALIRENKGNLSLALLVYNRGPVAVQTALNSGIDPTNGYEHVVTKGYHGRGTLD